MADFYSEMADMAAELLAPTSDGGLGQGSVLLKRIVTTEEPIDPDQPWLGMKEVETPATWALKAAVRTVSLKYVDGTLILAGDRQVIFSVPATTPLLSDALIIDGKEFVMKDLRANPGAGTVVNYIAFIAA